MSRKRFDPLESMVDDGLFTPEVRQWSEKKYKLLSAYCSVFTASMKNKWENLVYIDLFSGAGHAKIIENGKILRASPTIALNHPFTKYIFCEADEKRFEALNDRVKRDYPQKNIVLLHGDANEKIEEIKYNTPKYSRNNRVLTFCFVDPYTLNLNFSTIRDLSENYNIDFLILLALHMDANRNMMIYLEEENAKIEKFVGMKNWRNTFLSQNPSGQNFVSFLAESYKKNMKELGYVEPEQMERFKSNVKNLSLYYLAFFSKHPLGNKFWKEIKKYGDDQLSLF